VISTAGNHTKDGKTYLNDPEMLRVLSRLELLELDIYSLVLHLGSRRLKLEVQAQDRLRLLASRSGVDFLAGLLKAERVDFAIGISRVVSSTEEYKGLTSASWPPSRGIGST
jgi:hypothetical protein